MILPRIITAIIGIPLVILAIWWGGIPFFILMAGVTFLAVREFFSLTAHGRYDSYPVIGTICGMLLFISIFLNNTMLAQITGNQGTSVILTLLMAPVFIAEMLRKNTDRAIERLSITFFGAFFVPWALAHLILIRNLPSSGMNYLFFLFITIWTLDTGAYFFGTRFGRRKLAETISPRKTVEGAVGGIITGAAVAMLLRFLLLRNNLTLAESALLGVAIAIVAQFSDLVESIFKRDVGVKDSAALLPGHGGMLDRFDSFLFTAPLLYYYLSVFKG
jgi:phosphatidate cytidylyltransferase